MAAAPSQLGVDVGTSGGDWLFKQDDMLLGPVPAKVLVDKLYKGEITGRTFVAREGSDDFVPIETIDFFKVHAKKAQVKVQIDKDTTTQIAVQKKQRNLKLGGFGAVGLIVLAGGAYGAYWLAVNKPWRNANDADLITISVEAPAISLAAKPSDEVAIAIPEPSGTNPAVPAPPHKGVPTKHHGSTAPTPSASPQTDATDPDGMKATQQFDSATISQIAQQKANTVYPCIKAEAVAHPPTDQVNLPLEFTVGNDGRVGKVWVDNHDFGEGTPLYACLVKTLKTWSFPHYEGEQANVKLKFAWGPKH
ncbi:MAG: AgmX/PglI C-terminal domain-containing protein [Deltaproteobacteria bacterium]|nr:AgmX/PglI C-terminal domain-containing protein [Deltaproteobacteria bacterium]